jgi:hypothetical protein
VLKYKPKIGAARIQPDPGSQPKGGKKSHLEPRIGGLQIALQRRTSANSIELIELYIDRPIVCSVSNPPEIEGQGVKTVRQASTTCYSQTSFLSMSINIYCRGS